MSDGTFSSGFIPYMPAANASIEVHNVAAITERALWSWHICFAALVIIGFVLIFAARGPRRRDAHGVVNVVNESQKNSTLAQDANQS